jgi:hypothetical protein
VYIERKARKGRKEGLRDALVAAALYTALTLAYSEHYLAQALLCYNLLFFSPAIALYIVWEMITRGSWRDRRMVLGIVAACVVVFLATVPFLLPHLELRQLGFSPRSTSATCFTRRRLGSRS